MTAAVMSPAELRGTIVEVRERNRRRLAQCRVRLAHVEALREADALRPQIAALDETPQESVGQISECVTVQDPPIFFKESALAHTFLDGLSGLEIGGSAHNAFGLNTKNVGISAEMEPHDFEIWKQTQIAMCGTFMPIDIPGYADAIPVADSSQDFVLNAHVWEHLPDPLGALEEWVRVVRPDGYLCITVPKREAADAGREITPLRVHIAHHLLNTSSRARSALDGVAHRSHYSVFSGESLTEIETWFNVYHEGAQLRTVAYQETDDKVGNGHMIIWQVVKR